jgi:hypothetical protein
MLPFFCIFTSVKYTLLKHGVFFCFFLLSLKSLNAQYALVLNSRDTLTYANRTLTKNIDSVAIVHSGYNTLQPGGNFISLGGIYQSNYNDGLTLFQNHAPRFKPLSNHYAGLPHLGFFYSFGSRGMQNIHLDYQQTIAKKFDINLKYDGYILSEQAGFLRHSGYKNNVIQLVMNYHGERYQGLYFLNYYFGKRLANQGVVADSLLASFPLQLIPVNNESTSSKFNQVEAGTQHLFSFTKDSVVKHGFVYENELKIQNRKYNESGLNLLSYGAIYKDSTLTYDHYQWWRIRNSAGYFVQSKRLKIAAKAFHQYWKYKDQGINMDTTEVGVDADLLFNWSAFELKSRFEMTFIGAIGELESESHLKWKSSHFNLSAFAHIENKYPAVFLRNYRGNSIKWNITSSMKLQQTIKVGGTFEWTKVIPFQATVSWSNLSNHYWLIDNQLRNDTLQNVSLLNVNTSARFKVKTFHFDPYLAFNLTSKNIHFVPMLDARLNLYWNKKLFKTKKFDFILGATVRYQTKYNLVAYNNLVDLYQFSSTASMFTFNPIVRLDIFTGFQIDNFRFFARYENIDSFWNKRQNFTTYKYPISQGVIHIGLTWDFFN